MSEKYKAPMTIVEGPTIFEQVADEIEDRIAYRASAQLGVVVDKEELQKALVYDRHQYEAGYNDGYRTAMQEKAEWISIENGPPTDLQVVNVTWVNHKPASYYENIKDKPFVAPAVYFNGQWYWWSPTCADILAEYSCCYDNVVNAGIEITAWMPLPEPYKAESEDKE